MFQITYSSPARTREKGFHLIVDLSFRPNLMLLYSPSGLSEIFWQIHMARRFKQYCRPEI